MYVPFLLIPNCTSPHASRILGILHCYCKLYDSVHDKVIRAAVCPHPKAELRGS